MQQKKTKQFMIVLFKCINYIGMEGNHREIKPPLIYKTQSKTRREERKKELVCKVKENKNKKPLEKVT